MPNPFTPPHQTYLDVIQQQDKTKCEIIKINNQENTQSIKSNDQSIRISNAPDLSINSPIKQQSSTDKSYGESTSPPKITTSNLQLPSQIISEELATKNMWTKVEQTKQPIKSQQVESTPVCTNSESSHGRSKQIQKPPDVLNYNKLGGNLASTTELLQTEEPLVDNLTIQHIANQCSVYSASDGIDCKVDFDLSKSTVKCLQKFDELQPH